MYIYIEVIYVHIHTYVYLCIVSNSLNYIHLYIYVHIQQLELAGPQGVFTTSMAVPLLDRTESMSVMSVCCSVLQCAAV